MSNDTGSTWKFENPAKIYQVDLLLCKIQVQEIQKKNHHMTVGQQGNLKFPPTFFVNLTS